MDLHIELDSSHSLYEWLEKQADKIEAKGHFGTHIDCYTSTPSQSEYYLPTYILDCREAMPQLEEIGLLPTLEGKALILHTGNMYKNDYGTKAYFDKTKASITKEVLTLILKKKPKFILIDSYGIGKHGEEHISLDKQCETSDCYVIENINIVPEFADNINAIRILFDLNYPSTGKPCKVISV